jgi:hypothetical protein
MLTRILPLLLPLLLLPLLTGCDAHLDDTREIREVYADLEFCYNARDGAKVVTLLTRDTFDHYDRLLKLGLDAKPDEVRALPPMDKMEVLRMRLLGRSAELARMNGRQYIEFATSQGWYITPPDERTDDRLERFRFGAGEATAELVMDGWRTGARFRFVKEDGAWKIDEPVSLASWDSVFRQIARDEGMTVDELIFDLLEDEVGHEIPESVWQPMRR